MSIRIILTSVLVGDQEKAHRFYTDVLGFQTRHDIPCGDVRWLTVVAPCAPEGPELLLEPVNKESVGGLALTYQAALHAEGIAAACFGVEDVDSEIARLKGLGVRVTTEPTEAGPAKIAVIDDTCGNLIQLLQPMALAGSGE